MQLWTPRILVIGAGAGGIAAASRLLEDGCDDLVIADRADGVGGVWRANSYPGVQCDVPSHLYSLSFHPKPNWSRRFADGGEILAYLEDVVAARGLKPYLRLGTEVTGCAWDDVQERWNVGLRGPDGAESSQPFDLVIAATGQLSAPAVPELPGLDRFAGPVFHSARWRHDVPITGRRVGVIGTGASATQFLPALARDAAHVQLFQRSAPYIIGKPNRRYTALERSAYATLPGLLALSRLRQYLWHELLGVPFTSAPALMALPTASWRRRMHGEITDPALRAALTPDHRMGCKRLLRAPDWYVTLARPDVAVSTAAISEVVPGGIRTADGQLHDLDVLVLGTGFQATRFLTPMQVTGPGGRDLAEHWRDGAHAYLGTAVSGFPNFFLLYGPGTNLGHSSVIFMIESQIAWIRSAVAHLRSKGRQWVDIRPEVQSRYDARFASRSSRTIWETGCSSWYTHNGKNVNNWPRSTVSFRWRTRRFRPDDARSAPRKPAPLPSRRMSDGHRL